MMKLKRSVSFVAGTLLLLCTAVSRADDFTDSIQLFKEAGASKGFFDNCYGYAVFPGIGKGGFVVGGAHGNGRVYRKGAYTGDVSMTQVSVGFQIGGEAFREIVFFEDERAYNEFTKGSFEFAADATAVAITAGASASAGTTGATAPPLPPPPPSPPPPPPRPARLPVQAAGSGTRRPPASTTRVWPRSSS
jgi:hypothetical protein